MRKTGQVTLVSIAIMIEFIQFLIVGELLKREIVHLVITVVIALFVGRQYDKMKFHTERMKASEEYYKQLIETIPDAIFIHSQNMFLYVNQAGMDMLGAQKKEDLLDKYIYDIIDFHYQKLAIKRLKRLLEENKPTNDGELKISSEVNKGTMVEVILPTVPQSHLITL